jgi:hypothetical protein
VGTGLAMGWTATRTGRPLLRQVLPRRPSQILRIEEVREPGA